MLYHLRKNYDYWKELHDKGFTGIDEFDNNIPSAEKRPSIDFDKLPSKDFDKVSTKDLEKTPSKDFSFNEEIDHPKEKKAI